MRLLSCRRSRTSLLALAGLGLTLAVPLASPVAADATYAEQVGHSGVNTFRNYHNASGMGQHIDASTTVQVSCKVLDTFIQSANPDGYWYRIASSPWNNEYYSPANTFYNGDPVKGPYTHNTDFGVPDCGAAPSQQPAPAAPPPPAPPAPAPSATLARGPAAQYGYRYAISLNNFPANSRIDVSCYDSADPGGFYSFSLTTDGAGNASTAAYCYSANGPEYWFVANGVESNHVTWSDASGGGSATPPNPDPIHAPPPAPTTKPEPTSPSSSRPTTMNAFYNRSAAKTWALSHAKDEQAYGAMCTWFVSQALWAGGFPKTSTWTNAGRYTSAPGTKTAWVVPDFLKYVQANFPTTWTSITTNLRTNAVPQAEVGDIIAYDWGKGDKVSHLALVVSLTRSRYPVVSEMGQYDWNAVDYAKNKLGIHKHSDYSSRGWTYSAKDQRFLQVRYPKMKAYLLHFDGGYTVGRLQSECQLVV